MDAEPSLFGLLGWGANGWSDELAYGLLLTLQISTCSYFFAFLLGLLGAGAKLSGNKVLYRIGDLYTTLVRAIPELLLIILIYYAGGSAMKAVLVGIGIVEEDVVVALGSIYGAYLTDVLRGAIEAIPKGQIEAARAYGMRGALRFRRIVFPQMIRYAIPGMGNQWLNITKDSALVSAVGAFEVLKNVTIAASATKEYLFFLSIAGLIFLCLTIVSMTVLARIEKRANRGVRRV